MAWTTMEVDPKECQHCRQESRGQGLVGSLPTPAFHPSTACDLGGCDESDDSRGGSNSSSQEGLHGQHECNDSQPHEPKEKRIGRSAPHPPIGGWRMRFGVWSLPPSELHADGEKRPGDESQDCGYEEHLCTTGDDDPGGVDTAHPHPVVENPPNRGGSLPTPHAPQVSKAGGRSSRLYRRAVFRHQPLSADT